MHRDEKPQMQVRASEIIDLTGAPKYRIISELYRLYGNTSGIDRQLDHDQCIAIMDFIVKKSMYTNKNMKKLIEFTNFLLAKNET